MGDIQSYEAFILPDGTINPNSISVVEAIPFDSAKTTAILTDINSTSQIDFNLDGDNDVLLSSDNGNLLESYLSIGSSLAFYGYDRLSNFAELDSANSNIHRFGVELLNATYTGSNDIFVAFDNVLNNATSRNELHIPMLISTQNGRVNAGLTNTGIGGGSDIIAKTNEAWYSNQFIINNGEAFETIIAATTPTADRTATIQNSSGTFAWLSDINDSTATAKVANYTAVANDFVLMTTGAADKTVILPAVASNTNAIIEVKKVDSGAGNVIIDGNASETIDGALTKTISSQYTSVTLHCDGSTWHIK